MAERATAMVEGRRFFAEDIAPLLGVTRRQATTRLQELEAAWPQLVQRAGDGGERARRYVTADALERLRRLESFGVPANDDAETAPEPAPGTDYVPRPMPKPQRPGTRTPGTPEQEREIAKMRDEQLRESRPVRRGEPMRRTERTSINRNMATEAFLGMSQRDIRRRRQYDPDDEKEARFWAGQGRERQGDPLNQPVPPVWEDASGDD